jgi:hypothetical protein
MVEHWRLLKDAFTRVNDKFSPLTHSLLARHLDAHAAFRICTTFITTGAGYFSWLPTICPQSTSS